jgi:ABC-2 type transport system permease protein
MSLRVFGEFVRLRLKERMEYRAAYVIGIVAQIFGYGAQFVVLWLLLNRFGAIAGWTWPQVAFLYSFELVTYALGAALTFSPMTDLERMVRDGTFDGVLVRPTNPYVYLTARMYNVGYVAHVLLSAGVLIWAATQLDLAWNALSLTYLAASIVSAALIQMAALTFIGGWAFSLGRVGFLFTLHYQLKDFVLYPISVYGASIQVLLTVIVPFAFINFYPASAILSKTGGLFPGWIGWLAPIVGPLLFFGAYRFWFRGVNSYQGAGG